MAKPSPLEDHLDIVGVIPDREVAEQLGMTAENVRAWRNRRKIPARWRTGAAAAATAPKSKTSKQPPKATQTAPAAPVARKRLSTIDRFGHLLGVIPDATIAHLSGLKLATVGKARAKRGIPPVQGGHEGPPPRHRKSKMDPYLHLLGKEADSEIAALSGVSSKNVSNFRRRHGIPSARQLTAEKVVQPEVVAPVEVAPSAPEPAPVTQVAPTLPSGDGVQWAFKATVERSGVDRTYVVFGPDLAQAAALAASRLGEGDRIKVMESVATVL